MLAVVSLNKRSGVGLGAAAAAATPLFRPKKVAYIDQPIDINDSDIGMFYNPGYKSICFPVNVSGYELIYFNVRGRAQSMRYLFFDNDIKFTEVDCAKDGFQDWQTNWKHKMAFGQVPCLKDGDFQIVQSNAILRHLGRKHSLYGSSEKEATQIDILNDGVEDLRISYTKMIYTNYENGKEDYIKSLPDKLAPFETLLAANPESKNGFAVGGKVSFMDYNLIDFLDALQVLSPGCLDKFASIKAYFEAFLKRPGIQKARDTEQFKTIKINGNGKQ